MTPVFAWPVGATEADRAGAGVPPGWSIVIGYAELYWLGIHTGLDLNKPGQADFGAPCHAVADGVVTHSGELSGTWGKVIVIHHPQHGLWSRYGHLSRLSVTKGKVVRQGDVIGAVGDADGRLSAHLHYDLMRVEVQPGNWPSGKSRSQSATTMAEVRRIYVDPMEETGK